MSEVSAGGGGGGGSGAGCDYPLIHEEVKINFIFATLISKCSNLSSSIDMCTFNV